MPINVPKTDEVDPSIGFEAYEPAKKTGEYDSLRHHCGGYILDMTSWAKWTCTHCHGLWAYDRIDSFSDDEYGRRFFGRPVPKPGLRLVWVQEGNGMWHLAELGGLRGDSGTLPDGRSWRKVTL